MQLLDMFVDSFIIEGGLLGVEHGGHQGRQGCFSEGCSKELEKLELQLLVVSLLRTVTRGRFQAEISRLEGLQVVPEKTDGSA